ncbi:acyltransferase [Akkermansia sp.]|uniref:acyltransferase n=1 Tax=Akkermansia sp. TaxID=1872421 RepID=UPI0025C1C0C1|nr:acyltransferase [Akkermansia sp.]MCC8149409.1 acyltransferase [Akkermansia sp.]
MDYSFREKDISLSYSSRNHGIDLLRIISMYMVLILHIMGCGGVFEKIEWLSWNYFISWGLSSLSFCAVNCYAMISGYICYSQKFDYARIIRLWMQVIFYTVGITVLFAWIMPQGVGFKKWILAFFPITLNQYWYVSSYFALFFCMPFLNFIVNRLDRRLFIKLLVTMVVLFSLIPTFTLGKDGFGVSHGYSPLWLGVLYLLGAGIRKYQWFSGISSLRHFLLFVGCAMSVLISKVVIEISTFYLFGAPERGGIFLEYNSPLIVAAALFLFMACLKRTYESRKLIACITFFAPLSFGVYLIHCQYFIWHYGLRGRFASYAELAPWLMLAAILLTGGGIYLAASLVDFIRLKMFQVCRIHEISNWMFHWIQQGYRKIFYWCNDRE